MKLIFAFIEMCCQTHVEYLSFTLLFNLFLRFNISYSLSLIGLQRYKVPQGANKILFRPCVKRGQPRPSTDNTLGSQTPSNIVAISSTQQYLDNVTVNTGDDDKTYYCIECDASLTLEHHFK